MKAVRVVHGKVVWGKHKNDYPNVRDRGATDGGNVRYDRKNPTKSMSGCGYAKVTASGAGMTVRS